MSAEKSVLDSIDLPIRNLVHEINRIGIPTVFSCCGFSYPEEEEEKSHAKNAFVQFDWPTSECGKEAVLPFIQTATTLGWRFVSLGAGRWGIDYTQTPDQEAYWQKSDGQDEAIHRFEHTSIAIYRLQKSIEKWPGQQKYAIVDGNARYHEMGIYWKAAAKPTACIGVNYTER